MFHPSNGRDNFQPFSPTVSFEDMPDKETLIKILRRENELRLSKEVQDQYWYASSSFPSFPRFPASPPRLPHFTMHRLTGNFFDITVSLQTEAVSEYGYTNPWIIPSALTYYRDDIDITNIPHYVRFNR
jgi:hypothetical protein